MSDESLLIAILGIVASYFAIKKYIEVSRDVSEVYLNEQAHAEVTRLENESAIHKSNRLDYSNGLRAGLDIRYDHYKLRNGNLADIWEIVMNFVKKKDKGIKFGDNSCTFSELNHKVNILGDYFVSEEIKVLGMNIKMFLESPYSFAIMVGCFVNQVTVNFYDEIENTEDVDFYIINKSEIEYARSNNKKYILLDLVHDEPIPEILKFDGKLSSFENRYTVEKDKGVALRLTRKTSSKVISNVDFTQMNLVSSLASMLKHLPKGHEVSSNDIILILQSFDDNEEILGDLNKVLIALITNCDLTTSKNVYEEILNEVKPTILSISESKFLEHFPLEKLKKNLSIFQKQKFAVKSKLIANGILSNISVYDSPIRLLYINKSIEKKMKLDNSILNEYRAYFNSRIIFERGYFCLAGSVILNDFFDYRSFSIKNQLKAFGCLSQSLEAKLTNYHNKIGILEVRGYIIGKTHNRLIGKDGDFIEQALKNRQNNGFMPINIKCKWGYDGCLYVF